MNMIERPDDPKDEQHEPTPGEAPAPGQPDAAREHECLDKAAAEHPHENDDERADQPEAGRSESGAADDAGSESVEAEEIEFRDVQACNAHPCEDAPAAGEAETAAGTAQAVGPEADAEAVAAVPAAGPRPNLKPILEALLFACDGPVSANKLAEAAGSGLDDVRAALLELQTEYHEQGRGFTLEEIAGGYQLLSRPAYGQYVERLQKRESRTKLSAAALETLAIIAYKQPIGRADIEAIRGVQAGPLLRMLMDKSMIRITGRLEVIGRPFLYGTTKKFLEHFGLKSLEDLPKAEQLQMP